jgi:hypothetical protein
MSGSRRFVSFLAIAAIMGGARLAPAQARAPLVLGIPGLSSHKIAVEGVQRLDDGGALIAATLRPRRTSRPSRVALVRMLGDGSLDLAYGRLGISTPPLGDAGAIALAVNPATAEAWIGVRRRLNRGEIVAVDGQGGAVRGFGRAGRIELRAGVPQAIAWRTGQLFVAMGNGSCQGCTVALVNGATGAAGPMRRLDPSALVVSSPPCAARSISSALFTTGGNVLLGVDATGPGCAAALDEASPAKLIATGNGMTVTAPFSRTVRNDVLARLGGQTCVAGSGSRGTEFGALAPHGTARPAFRGPAGPVVGVVALGRGACALLVRAHDGGIVLQADARHHVTRDAVPRRIEPLGMFRCHHHLLIIGSTARGSGQVVVIPVRRGPYAGAIATLTSRLAAGRDALRCSVR